MKIGKISFFYFLNETFKILKLITLATVRATIERVVTKKKVYFPNLAITLRLPIHFQ